MTGYWPFSAHVCGFWFLPMAWQYSCNKCKELLCGNASNSGGVLCVNHAGLEHFTMGNSYSSLPIFIGLSSIGRWVSYSNEFMSVFLFHNDISLSQCSVLDMFIYFTFCLLDFRAVWFLHKCYLICNLLRYENQPWWSWHLAHALRSIDRSQMRILNLLLTSSLFLFCAYFHNFRSQISSISLAKIWIRPFLVYLSWHQPPAAWVFLEIQKHFWWCLKLS